MKYQVCYLVLNSYGLFDEMVKTNDGKGFSKEEAERTKRELLMKGRVRAAFTEELKKN